MQHIFRQLLDLLALGYGAEGIAAVSGILTVAAVLSVILIGSIMNGIEKFQINLLGKIFGLKAALFFTNYVTIAGTIIHECSHALFAICTGAKVTEISFLDTKGDSLGHICYITRGPVFMRGIQDSMCSCAPVFVGLICEGFVFSQIIAGGHPIWETILLWYLAISIIDHMSMSPIDIKHYFQGIWAVIPIVFAVIFCYGYFVVT